MSDLPVAAPANDNFANARLLGATNETLSVDLSGATFEPSEPTGCSAAYGMPTVWYRFAPAVRTQLTIDSENSAVNAALGAYAGTSLYTLRQSACSRAQSPTHVTVVVSAGDTLYIQATDNSGGGILTVNVALAPAAPNDDFSDARDVGSLPFAELVDTSGATVDPGEPSACGSLTRSVWYRYTAVDNVTLTVSPDQFGVALGAYSGSSLATLTSVICHSNYGPIRLSVPAGDTVYIQAGSPFGYTRFAVGFSGVVPPANDNFADARVISTLPFTETVDPANAAVQAGEPSECRSGGSPSIWYRYTATADVTFVVRATTYARPAISAFTGNTIGSLTLLACEAGYPGNDVKVAMPAGTTVFIRAISYEPITLQFAAGVAPINDDFGEATLIPALPFNTTVDLSNATTEAGEPEGCGIDSVWYRFDPPEDVLVEASVTYNISVRSRIAAYAEGALGSLTQLACTYDYATQIRFAANRGEPVYLRVGSEGSAGPGSIALHVVGFAHPPNDDRAAATNIPSLPFADAVDTRGATAEPDEPGAPPCKPAASVWYAYTSPADELIAVDTFASTFTPSWTMYNDALTPVASSCEGLSVSDVARVAAGQHVLLQMGVAPGTLVLHVDPLPRIPNDDLSNATRITDLPFAANLDLDAAGPQVLEPTPCFSASRTVWFDFTAPSDMVIAAEAGNANTYAEPVVAAYGGDAIDALTVLACNDGPNRISRVQIPIAAGETVHLQVAVKGNETHVPFRVEQAPVPPNDSFATAAVITSLPFSAGLDNEFASTEPGERLTCPGYGDSFARTIWYKFTASSALKLAINTDGSSTSFNRFLAVYTGASFNALTSLGCSQYDARMQVSVAAGQTIYVQLGSKYEYEHGTLQLHVAEIVRPANDDRANATEITSVPYSDDVNILGATAEPGEEPCREVKSVWYRYRPAQDVILRASAGGPGESGAVRAFVETSPGVFTPSSCESSLLVRVNAGQLVYLRVAASGSRSGAIAVHVTADVPLANDNFADAEEIASLPFSTEVDTTLATHETGEPGYGCGPETGSAWYKLTSPTDAIIVLDSQRLGSGTSDAMGVFSGTTLGNLVQVACSDFFTSDHVQFEMSAGSTVYIRIGSSSGGGQQIALDVKEVPRPINDDFADAHAITALPFSTTLTKAGATLEPAEPRICGYRSVTGSLWYRFTVDQNAKVLIRTDDASGDAMLAAYTGTELGSLTSLGCAIDYHPKLTVNVSAGTTIYVQVGGTVAVSPVKLDIIPLIAPENDNIANARRIGALPYEDTQRLLAATVEPGEPSVCGLFNTVWYVLTPDVDTTVRIDGGDAQVSAFVPASGAAPTDADLVGCGSHQQVRVEGGKTLYIRAGGFVDEVVLRLSRVHPPANDRIADAIEITTLPFADEVSTVDASTEFQEPPGCRGMATTVWYRYTASENVTLSVDTFGSDFDTLLAAYRSPIGDPPGGLQLIDCFDEFLPTDHERLQFPVAVGETIYIQAGGYIDFTGDLSLHVRPMPVPSNDSFRNATNIDTLPFSAELDTSGASVEAGETASCWAPLDDTVWYRFTAPSAMALSVGGQGSDHQTVIAAYVVQDTVLPPRPRDAIACAAPRYLSYPPPVVVPGPGVIHFSLTEGQTVYIQAAAADKGGQLKLQVVESVPPENDGFAAARPITALPFSDAVSTFGATQEAFEQNVNCATSFTHTVWYSFTAPRDLVVRFDTEGTDHRASLAAYAGGAADALLSNDLLSCDVRGGVSKLRLSMHGGDTVYVQVRDEGGDVVLNGSIEQEGLLPPVEIVALSPIALERELLALRDALHDNIEPSTFDADGLSFFDLCQVVYELRATSGRIDQANRLNSNGDYLPCNYNDYIPPGEITPADFAKIDLDANQLSENATSYTDGLIIVAFVNTPDRAPILFSSAEGTWRGWAADAGAESYLCDTLMEDSDCVADANAYLPANGIVTAGLSGPLTKRGDLPISVRVQGTTSSPAATLTLNAVGDPARLTLADAELRVEAGEGTPCQLPVYAQVSRAIPDEIVGRAAAFDAALLLATVVDSDGTAVANIPLEWTTDGSTATIGMPRGFTSQVAMESAVSLAGPNLACGAAPGKATFHVSVQRAANGACTRPQDSNEFGGAGVCFGRKIEPISDRLEVQVVGVPDRIVMSAEPDTVACDGKNTVAVRAQVLDAAGEPGIAGRPVKFAGTSGSVDPEVGITGEDGFASTTLTPDALGQDTLVVAAEVAAGVTSQVTIPCAAAAEGTFTPVATRTAAATRTAVATRSAVATPSVETTHTASVTPTPAVATATNSASATATRNAVSTATNTPPSRGATVTATARASATAPSGGANAVLSGAATPRPSGVTLPATGSGGGHDGIERGLLMLTIAGLANVMGVLGWRVIRR